MLLGAAGGPPRPFQHPTMPNHMGPEPSPLPASGPWSAAAMQELWVVRFLGIVKMVKWFAVWVAGEDAIPTMAKINNIKRLGSRGTGTWWDHDAFALGSSSHTTASLAGVAPPVRTLFLTTEVPPSCHVTRKPPVSGAHPNPIFLSSRALLSPYFLSYRQKIGRHHAYTFVRS